ncbi:MAG: sigma 54-interacting transcriptional regulator [Bacillota bacterium]
MTIKNLKPLKVKNVLSTISIQNMISAFKEENMKYAVVHENGYIRGIITENELLDAYLYGLSLTESIKSIVNNHVCFVENSCTFDKIASILKEDPTMHIIVGDENKDAEGIITKEVVLSYFYTEIKKRIYASRKEKNKAERHCGEDIFGDKTLAITKLIHHLDQINLWNKELDQAFENSPNAFVILDGKGNTVRVNKEFENITDIKKEDVTGKNVKEMEEKGAYNPSVGVLILKEKRKISIIQKLQNGKEALVTGVPIYDENGNIFRIIINSIDFKELNIINQYYEKQKERNALQEKDGDVKIIYESESMKRIMQLTNELKNIDSTILITGESGVGKGVIARYLHNNGIRKKERMVEINCGAIPEALLESELLGYEAGAFTGAKKSGKPGLIELANKGTLFLDEIGEMPMQLQIKLLQVIQERKITRVGGINPIDIDVRIIAATNKDLQEMVKKGRFRLDLFYRLNVIPLNIPSLKERQLDIIPMVTFFLDKYNKKYNKDVRIGKSILSMMLAYDWPGNVRELENTIERLVVTNPSALIEKDNNKSNIFSFDLYDHYVTNSDLIEKITPLEEAKKEIEKKLIKMAYRKYKSSYKVAEILKISQATAYRKIREYLNDELINI